MSTEFNVRGFKPEPDSPKHWSYEDKLKARMKATLEGDVDLRPFSGPRQNQRDTGSCVANAVVKALEIKRLMAGKPHVDLSRRVVYYLARELMFPPQTHIDDGTYISHACDVLRRFGVCPEADFIWDPAKINEAPTWSAMRKAYVHKIDSFYKIRSTGDARVAEVVECLRAGNPVVYGTEVGNNWFDYQKGQVLGLPSSVDGAHATVLLGWEDGHFIGENSWGNSWGDNGFYLMSPKVIASGQSHDFWVIQAGFEEYK